MSAAVLTLPGRRRIRRPSLTPMIDVVFLLLVFFMLASRFTSDEVIAVSPAGTGGETGYAGPPRLVEVTPGALTLNGAAMDEAALIAQLAALTDDPSDMIVLRAAGGADLQRLVTLMGALGEAGFTGLVLVE